MSATDRGRTKCLTARLLGEERGNALVITVLVCMAMTGLALVAVTTVNVQGQLASNENLLQQSHYVSEEGMILTMQRLQNFMGAASLRKERQRLLLEDPLKKISFHWTFPVFPNGAQREALVEVEDMREAPPAAGFQINTEQPPLEVSLIATGRVGRLNVQQQDLQVGFSERRVWALIPVP